MNLLRNSTSYFIFCLLFGLTCYGNSQSDTNQVPAGIVQLGNGSFYNPHAIVVDKTARTLSVWKQREDSSLEKVIEFPSDIGKKAGNKSRLGDHRTPEGIYFIQKMIEGKGLPYDLYGVRAFTLDYPNLFDQRMGKTGSGIWIHAIPEKETLERGSRGCVVVRNDAILKLSDYILVDEKTPVLIYDKVPYQDQKTKKTQNAEVEGLLAKWLESWQSENLESYMSFYSENFYSLKMNKDRWRNYKDGLSKKYDSIQVHLYSPIILEHSGGFIVRALQAYRSNMFEDFGEKTLYLEKSQDGLKIIAEQWSPLPNPNITHQLAKCCSVPNQARN